MFNPSGARGRRAKKVIKDESDSDTEDDSDVSNNSETEEDEDQDSDRDSSSSSDDEKQRPKRTQIKNSDTNVVRLSFTRDIDPKSGVMLISGSEIRNQFKNRKNIDDYYIKEVNLLSSSSKDIPLRVYSPTFNQSPDDNDSYMIPRGLTQDPYSVFKVETHPANEKKISMLINQYGKRGELIKSGVHFHEDADAVTVPRKIIHPETKKEVDHPLVSFMRSPAGAKYKKSLERAEEAAQKSNTPKLLQFTLSNYKSSSSIIEDVYKSSIPPDISRGIRLECIKSDAKDKRPFNCQLDVQLVFAEKPKEDEFISSSSSSSSSSSKKTKRKVSSRY